MEEKDKCNFKQCECEDNTKECNCEQCVCEDDIKECDCEQCVCEDECTCEKSNDEKIEEDKSNKKNKKLKEEIKKLKEEIKKLNDKSLREKAELINYRKRKDEEVSKMLKFASEDIIKELLPVIDNFERAIKMDDNNLEDEISKFLSGFKMIYCNFISILEKNGVKQIDGKNKPFDPTYHQAVMTEKLDGVEKDMVIEVLQAGYLYKDKVIRPAMVKVSE